MPRDEDVSLDEVYYWTFITAFEGGINYWADVLRYEEEESDWSFEGEVRERDDEGDQREFKVTRKVIARGYSLITKGQVQVRADIRRWAREAYFDRETSNIDAEVSDVIVQAGLFGDIVYG